MKVVILAGGFGTRISEESVLIPKPMIEIGGMPIIWHIMKIYSHFGFNDFIVCAGYKQYVIKEYFANYYLHHSDITFDLKTNEMKVHENSSEPWKITVVDTGLNTMTGGRINRIQKYIGKEPFLLTYGDGVADVNINNLIDFHKKTGKKATISTYNAGQRFGVLDIDGQGNVKSFREKNDNDGSLINIGFMVLEPSVFDLIKDDSVVFEKYPMEELARQGELNAYKHVGFWQCMDTMRDKNKLEEYWASGKAPWKIWND